MALKFDLVRLSGYTSNNVNGQTIYHENPILLVEGIGAKVKINSYYAGGILVSTTPINQDLNDNDVANFLRLSDLPSEFYLAPGEKIYAAYHSGDTYTTVRIVHYVDEAPAGQSQPLNFTGSISLNQQ